MSCGAWFGPMRNRSRPGEVVRVHAPSLVGGRSCGRLQEAAVSVEFTSFPSPNVYFACYLSGNWVIESIALTGT
jgi:hypothetical protein